MITTKEEIKYNFQKNPDIKEIGFFLENAFNVLTPKDQANFDKEGNGQSSLQEWFDIFQIHNYLKYSFLIEARSKNKLIGLIMVGKQNPLSWPDGKKVEMFILAVDPSYRGNGIGSNLIKKAEEEAKKMGANKVIVNTHVLLTADQKLYEKLGFTKMGILKYYYGNGSAVFYLKKLN